MPGAASAAQRTEAAAATSAAAPASPRAPEPAHAPGPRRRPSGDAPPSGPRRPARAPEPAPARASSTLAQATPEADAGPRTRSWTSPIRTWVERWPSPVGAGPMRRTAASTCGCSTTRSAGGWCLPAATMPTPEGTATPLQLVWAIDLAKGPTWDAAPRMCARRPAGSQPASPRQRDLGLRLQARSGHRHARVLLRSRQVPRCGGSQGRLPRSTSPRMPGRASPGPSPRKATAGTVTITSACTIR